MNNKKQSIIDWLYEQQMLDPYGDFVYFDEVKRKAKEMEVAGKEMSYAEGYAEGYKRSLELIEWMIKTELKRNNVHESVNEKK